MAIRPTFPAWRSSARAPYVESAVCSSRRRPLGNLSGRWTASIARGQRETMSSMPRPSCGRKASRCRPATCCPGRTGPARTAPMSECNDHPQPPRACARRRIAHLDPHTTCAGSPQFCCRQPLEPDAANRSVTISQGRMRKRAVSCARSMRGRSQGRPLRSTGSQARGVNGSLISTWLPDPRSG